MEEDAVFMDFKTSDNVKLKLFAKPKLCEEGTLILHMLTDLYQNAYNMFI